MDLRPRFAQIRRRGGRGCAEPPEVTAPSKMEMEAAVARQAKESLELEFQVSQTLDTGLDRHTLLLLMALCDRGTNPEALATLVHELSSATPRPPPRRPPSPVSNDAASPAPAAASLFPSGVRRPRVEELDRATCLITNGDVALLLPSKTHDNLSNFELDLVLGFCLFQL